MTNRLGELPKRTSLRIRVRRPSPVRAGLFGKVVSIGTEDESRPLAVWQDAAGAECTATVTTNAEAVERVARNAAGGLRFHDLRHSYATWLVSSGVPVNDVQQVMGQEQASTTLDRYTHPSPERNGRVWSSFAALHQEDEEAPENEDGPSEKGPSSASSRRSRWRDLNRGLFRPELPAAWSARPTTVVAPSMPVATAARRSRMPLRAISVSCEHAAVDCALRHGR